MQIHICICISLSILVHVQNFINTCLMETAKYGYMFNSILGHKLVTGID